MEVPRFQSRLKPTSLDASMLLDVQHWQLGFTKSSIVAEIALSLSEIR
ncbi:DUF645 family protein [Vibrio cholerae]|nr:DUF645 family protein [Vibrio cholerae]EGQ96041.1 hypothetical protein VCHE39_3604 [Vibrio cholerae HE39]EGR4321929.1 DUF645 family protein [Vibrio cholerae]KAA1204744.1 DUF645 family protein [Vibrio cholerae]